MMGNFTNKGNIKPIELSNGKTINRMKKKHYERHL